MYGYPDETEPGIDDIHTRSIFDNRNYQLNSYIGDGVGYLRGFQSFGAFQPVVIEPDEFILWANPRGYVTYNSGSFAGNLGTGFRWLNPETQRIIGGSAWWDHDNNGANKYDQIGGSFESLGNYLDFRANCYIPTNQNIHQTAKFLNGNNVFIVNNIGVGQTTITNSGLRGGDFEVGGALPGIRDIGLRAYAGGYYYQGPESGGGVYGVRGRLEALVTQDVWASVGVSNDRLFGVNVVASATIYLGSGQTQQFFRPIPMQTRLYQQVERQYRVAVDQSVLNDTIVALRAGGTGGSGGPIGTPIFVLHVDNTAPPGGDGSFEHPLNHLPTSTPGNVDIVFVHRGTATTLQMDQGITLNNWERLLGEGVPHLFTDTVGTFTLPGFTPGPLPSITNINPGGSAVTLASHNEVSGFNIPSPALHGITGSNIVDFNINNVHVTSAGNSLGALPIGAGIQLFNASGTGLITDSTFTSNNAEGIRIDNTDTPALNLAVVNVQSNLNLTGIVLNATGSEINPTMELVTANSNRQDGISISLAASGATRSSMTGSFDHVTANDNNTVAPPVLLFGNGFSFTSDASDAVLAISHSTFDGNHLNGLSFTTLNNSSLNTTLLNNNSTINSNGANGVLFTSTDSQVSALLLNNVISNNGGFGIAAISKGTGAFATSFALTVGGYATQDTNGDGILEPGEDRFAIPSLGPSIIGNGLFDREGNIITNNHGAGISFQLIDQGIGTANIIGNTIQGTLPASPVSTTFLGQGIDIRVTGSTIASNSTASFAGGVIDANIIGSLTNPSLGNAGGGIRILSDQNTSFQNLQIGTALKGNIIANNGNDGINITRANTAQMGQISPIIINNNQIENNAGNGVTINAENSFDSIVNGFIVQNNIITTNALNGILLHVEADAQMNVDIHDNLISQNTFIGIQTTELVNSGGDVRGVSGTWARNEITLNGSDGIQLAAASGTFLGNLIIGSTTTGADGNIIQDNGGHGILMLGAGAVQVGFNLIDSNALGGIYVHAATINTFTIDNNVITNNGTLSFVADGGDGIQIVDTGVGAEVGPYNVTISNNTIRGNAGRGINILNRVNGDLTVDIESNNIKSNLLEGIYVVNTSSATQSADVLASQLMNADGSILRTPRMFLTVNNNDIEGNGILSTANATGLVVRVGTSDGGFGPNFDGGFFSEGLGGIGATVTNNTFHGNLGDDISFSSFVSTVDPGTTAGTWSDTVFVVTSYRSDPLSRLDLSFHNNTFDSTGLNVGNDPNGVANSNGAFYNNAEPDFKSRTNGRTLPDPNGPFTTGGRARNAERLAGRFLGILPPFTPQLAPFFRYPGMGQSTFRLLDASNGGSTTLADVVSAGFFVDNAPYTNPFFDANGVFRPGAGPDDMPYGWTFMNGIAPPVRPQ